MDLEVNGPSHFRKGAALAIDAEKQALIHAKKAITEGNAAAVAASKALRKAENFHRIGGDFAKALNGQNGLAHANLQQIERAAKASTVAAQGEEEISRLLKKSEYKADFAAKRSEECAKTQATLAALYRAAEGSFFSGSAQMVKLCKAENLAKHTCQRSSDALCDLHHEAVKLRQAVKLSNRAQKDAEEATKAASALKTPKAKQKVSSAVTRVRVASAAMVPAQDDEDPGGYEEAIADATRAEQSLAGEGPDDETSLMQI